MDVTTDRQHAHHLLDRLDPGQLGEVTHLLELMTDPVARSVASAPTEEEDITLETAAELDAARASLDCGQGVPHEEILRQFGAMPR